MKKLLHSITLAVGIITTGYSQDTNRNVIQDWFGGALSVSNWTVVPYMSYSQDVPEQTGYGVFAIYNLNNLVGVGLGVDAHGPVTMPSGNVSIKYSLKRDKLVFTPYAIGGVTFPLYTSNTDAQSPIGVFGGGGVSLTYQFNANIRAGLTYASVYRENNGLYSGLYHIIGPVFNVTF